MMVIGSSLIGVLTTLLGYPVISFDNGAKFEVKNFIILVCLGVLWLLFCLIIEKGKKNG